MSSASLKALGRDVNHFPPVIVDQSGCVSSLVSEMYANSGTDCTSVNKNITPKWSSVSPQQVISEGADILGDLGGIKCTSKLGHGNLPPENC
ncbi:hypothetical protein J6590_066573 [Homalodisca vitripennis]|nr:hypothetical protein J6590_066573 [Homalodisca vitripennis]